MTPQIGCDRRNPAGRLTLSSALARLRPKTQFHVAEVVKTFGETDSILDQKS